jgi:hypothetical protein
MKTLREYALEAWAQEQERRKQSERKKRKRRAKKIEEDIDDLLSRDAEGLQFERDLDDPSYASVVSITANVPRGTRRAIHFRGKMWMARQFHMSGLIASARSASESSERYLIFLS